MSVPPHGIRLTVHQAVTLPVSMTDRKWHHVCVTWSTRDGVWEVYQDGVKKGSGQNLAAWHAIKAGGIFILGQEQVRPTGSSIDIEGGTQTKDLFLFK